MAARRWNRGGGARDQAAHHEVYHSADSFYVDQSTGGGGGHRRGRGKGSGRQSGASSGEGGYSTAPPAPPPPFPESWAAEAVTAPGAVRQQQKRPAVGCAADLDSNWRQAPQTFQAGLPGHFKSDQRGKGFGKGKAKGGWGGNLPRHVRISKTLTQILRHKALDFGISIDKSGFCKTDDVLAVTWLRELQCTLEDVEKVVRESDKQRFEIRMNGKDHEIRAVQGHSIEAVEDEALLQKLSVDNPDLPGRCIHGTYRRYLQSILEEGLKPGGAEGACYRKHVHFTPFEPGDKQVISGMRYDAEVAIWVDLKRAMEAGIPFYISPNKVILSPGVDDLIASRFVEKVTDVKTGQIIS